MHTKIGALESSTFERCSGRMIVAAPSASSRFVRTVLHPVRIALVAGALVVVSVVAPAIVFARDVASFENAEPCSSHLLKPEFSVTVGADTWPCWGVMSGGYYGYGGPGGAFFRIGAGRLVVEVFHPRCS